MTTGFTIGGGVPVEKPMLVCGTTLGDALFNMDSFDRETRVKGYIALFECRKNFTKGQWADFVESFDAFRKVNYPRLKTISEHITEIRDLLIKQPNKGESQMTTSATTLRGVAESAKSAAAMFVAAIIDLFVTGIESIAAGMPTAAGTPATGAIQTKPTQEKKKQSSEASADVPPEQVNTTGKCEKADASDVKSAEKDVTVDDLREQMMTLTRKVVADKQMGDKNEINAFIAAVFQPVGAKGAKSVPDDKLAAVIAAIKLFASGKGIRI